MASNDVIELGSSDEETEPAPKKRKAAPNVMVRIPKNLEEITIKPTTRVAKINPACIIQGSIGKAVTVTKVPKNNANLQLNMKKKNGVPVKSSYHVQDRHSNQIVMRKSNASSISGIPIASANITKYPMKLNPLNIFKPQTNRPSNISKAVKVPVLKKIPVLPSDITVKKTGTLRNAVDGKAKKMPLSFVKTLEPSIVTTVNLDDDEPVSSSTTSSSGHQWYIRPENQEQSSKSNPVINNDSKISKSPVTNKTTLPEKVLKASPKKSEPEDTLEEENNKEPDKSTFIEITIEDSPLKVQHKKGFNVGEELAIVIDDSPIKNIKNMTDKTDSHNSDDEKNIPTKEPQSKKKLEYPIQAVETIDIEYEPHPEAVMDVKENETSINTTDKMSTECSIQKSETESKIEPVKCDNNTNINTECKKSNILVDVVEIEDSPMKPLEKVQNTTPKKEEPLKKSSNLNNIEALVNDKEESEFHPMYQRFINLCFQLENSEDMMKIVEKKIKSYYRQVPKDYTESEVFIDMISSKIVAMKAAPEQMYLYIKDVVDELNLQRKLAKSQPAAKETKNKEQENFLYGENSEFDSKRQRQIRKLEKTLKKLHRAIQKLEEQEVDFDDEDDSVYLLTDRYKERMVRVHAKLCQLTNTKMPSETRVQIDARPGHPKGPAKRLEKWINKKVPIGTPLPFPDFHDVLRFVREANQEDNLGWNEADIMEEARDLFTRCGKKLQRRRQENEWRLVASMIPSDVRDPAEDSTELKKKLEDNKRMAAKRETEVVNKYADKQNQLNLEGVEIGDKEAEESPVESDDEESVEDNVSMTNKEKRKERLKRLLQEKSKKASDEKENLSTSTAVEAKNAVIDDMAKDTPTETVFNTKSTDENIDKDPSDVNSQLDNSSNLPEFDKDDIEPTSSSRNKDDSNEQSDKAQSLSDSSKIDSDIDELHLLQKLYSENELNRSVGDSSDSATPIAISDSSENEISNKERKHKTATSDVISIENSSYSETEENKRESDCVPPQKEITKEPINVHTEIEYSSNDINKTNKLIDQEQRLSIEDTLLASSDDANDTEPCGEKQNTDSTDQNSETCVNLRDDNISIGETVIETTRKCDNMTDDLNMDSSDKNPSTDASSVEGMEIGPGIPLKEVIGPEENIEAKSIQLTDEESVTEIMSIKSTENTVESSSVKSIETIDDENSKEIIKTELVKSIEHENSDKTLKSNGTGKNSIHIINSNIDAEHITENFIKKSVESIKITSTEKQENVTIKENRDFKDSINVMDTSQNEVEEGNSNNSSQATPMEVDNV